MTKLTRDQVLQIVASAGERGEKPELFGANLGETEQLWAKLGGTKISGAELLRADLSGMDLRGVDLRQANLKQTNLQRANLSGVNLSAARYDQAILWPANFDPTRTGVIRED